MPDYPDVPPTDPKAALHARIANDFKAHPPKTDEVRAHLDVVAQEFESLAHSVIALCPVGRELSLCLTNLEAAKRDAIAAIACHQD